MPCTEAYKEHIMYICGSYKKRTADCTAHFIRTDLLTAGVTENLRKVNSYAVKKNELKTAEKRIAELSAIFKAAV